MFTADIQPPCASSQLITTWVPGQPKPWCSSVFYKRARGRQNRPTWSVFFWTGRIFSSGASPASYTPLPYHQKYWAKKYIFFHSTQKSHENPGFYWISPMDWAYISFFSMYTQKSPGFWA